MKSFCILGLLVLTGWSWAQDPVSGQATITFVEDGTVCGGAVKRVAIYVDVTGLTGQGGDAGLNAFALSLLLDNSNLFVRAVPGSDPIDFDFTATDAPLIDPLGELRLVGVKADPLAPNSEYHVADVWIGGQFGSVTLDLNGLTTTLGSRRIGNSGPGSIGYRFSGPITVQVTSLARFQLNDALPDWRTAEPAFDFEDTGNGIDIRDLVTLLQCTGS